MMGECMMVLELGRSRGFTAQPGSEGGSEGGRGVNLRDGGEKLRKCGKGRVCHVGV